MVVKKCSWCDKKFSNVKCFRLYVAKVFVFIYFLCSKLFSYLKGELFSFRAITLLKLKNMLN